MRGKVKIEVERRELVFQGERDTSTEIEEPRIQFERQHVVQLARETLARETLSVRLKRFKR